MFPRVANRDRLSFLQEDISFDEFVADINGSIAFAATKFAHQPGIAGTFPKGAIKAALYSEWKQVRCEYYYKPEVSGFAAQGATGKVILAMDYNAGNPAPTTKQQVEIMHRVDDMPYEAMSLVTDTASVNRSDAKYIRTGPIPVDEDIKTFDGGNLWVCTIGQAGAGLVGELHARYTFRCTKPTLLNPAQGALLPNVTVGMFASSVAEAAGATTIAKQMLYANAVSNGLGAVNTAGSIVPPAGNYQVDLQTTFANAGGTTTQASHVLLKNGVAVSAVVLPAVSSSTASDSLQLSLPWFVSANGTDAFTVTATQTYAAGAATNTGNIRFIAI